MQEQNQLNDFDKQYLRYILEGRNKTSFLGFLIPINLAVYAAVYYSNGGILFSSDIRGIPILLLLFLLTMNVLFAIIYIREEEMDEDIKEKIKKEYIEEKVNSKLGEQIKIFDGLDRPRKGRTRKSIILLLSLVVAMPFSILCLWGMLKFAQLSLIFNKLTTSPFFGLLLITTIVAIAVYFCFECRFKRPIAPSLPYPSVCSTSSEDILRVRSEALRWLVPECLPFLSTLVLSLLRNLFCGKEKK